MNIILDSDFLIADLVVHESTHDRALELHKKFPIVASIYFLDLVHFEIATVLSRKYSHQEAITSLDRIESLDITSLNYVPFEKEIWHLYRSQHRKNISFVDCANVVVARHLKAKIASFDTFYPRDLLLT